MTTTRRTARKSVRRPVAVADRPPAEDAQPTAAASVDTAAEPTVETAAVRSSRKSKRRRDDDDQEQTDDTESAAAAEDASEASSALSSHNDVPATAANKTKKRRLDRAAAFARAQAAMNGQKKGPVAALGTAPLATTTASTPIPSNKKPAVSARVAAAITSPAVPPPTATSKTPAPAPPSVPTRSATPTPGPNTRRRFSDRATSTSRLQQQQQPSRSQDDSILPPSVARDLPTIAEHHKNQEKVTPVRSSPSKSFFQSPKVDSSRVAYLGVGGVKPNNNNKPTSPSPLLPTMPSSSAPNVSTAPLLKNKETTKQQQPPPPPPQDDLHQQPKQHVEVEDEDTAPGDATKDRHSNNNDTLEEEDDEDYEDSVQDDINEEEDVDDQDSASQDNCIHTLENAENLFQQHRQQQQQHRQLPDVVPPNPRSSLSGSRNKQRQRQQQQQQQQASSQAAKEEQQSSSKKEIEVVFEYLLTAEEAEDRTLKAFEDLKHRRRRQTLRTIIEFLLLVTISCLVSHHLGQLFQQWDRLELERRAAEGNTCFYDHEHADSTQKSSPLLDDCAQPHKVLQPCPAHGLCQGGMLVACSSPYMIPETESTTVDESSAQEGMISSENDDAKEYWPLSCVLSTSVNGTIADMMTVLHQWTVDHFCRPKSTTHTVAEHEPGFPLFNYTLLAETLGIEYDLELIAMVNEFYVSLNNVDGKTANPLFWVVEQEPQKQDGEESEKDTTATSVLIGLHSSQTLSIPATCTAKRWIVTLIRTLLYIVYCVLSFLFWTVLTKPFYVVIKFFVRVFWSIFLEFPLMTTLLTLMAVAVVTVVQNRRRRRVQREVLHKDIERAKTMVLESLQKFTYEHRVDTVRDTIKARIVSSSLSNLTSSSAGMSNEGVASVDATTAFLFNRNRNNLNPGSLGAGLTLGGTGSLANAVNNKKKNTRNTSEKLKQFDQIIWPKVKKFIQSHENIHSKEVRQGMQFIETWQWVEPPTNSRKCKEQQKNN